MVPEARFELARPKPGDFLTTIAFATIYTNFSKLGTDFDGLDFLFTLL
jgi:hypothetical protein